jgi:hypothetical protein
MRAAMRARALLDIGDLPHGATGLILWLLRDRSVNHRRDHVVLHVDSTQFGVLQDVCYPLRALRMRVARDVNVPSAR